MIAVLSWVKSHCYGYVLMQERSTFGSLKIIIIIICLNNFYILTGWKMSLSEGWVVFINVVRGLYNHHLEQWGLIGSLNIIDILT